MKAGTLVALLIPLLAGLGVAKPEAGPAALPISRHSVQLAEAETGGAQHSATDETRDSTRDETSDYGAGASENGDAAGNWLAWLVGLPLLAGLLLLVLLLTRSKRAGREDEADE